MSTASHDGVHPPAASSSGVPVGGAFVALLGLGEPTIRNGEAVVELEVAPEHLNAGGIAHGGFLSALADWVTGAAVHARIPGDRYAPHSSLSMQFVRGVRAGQQLRCYARCTSAGARTATGEAELTADGALVARALSTHTIIERR